MTHLIALFLGWIAYVGIAHGLSPTAIKPMSEAGLRIVGSALLSMVATSAVFYMMDIQHPMAFVIGLTAAIGAFPTIPELIVTILVVSLISVIQIVVKRLAPESDRDLNLSGGHLF